MATTGSPFCKPEISAGHHNPITHQDRDTRSFSASLAVAVIPFLTTAILQQDAIAMTSCCKPCDTQPRTALSIIHVSPGSSGHFLR